MQKALSSGGFLKRGTPTVVLTDDCSPHEPKYPSRVNIHRGLKWLIEGAEPGDALSYVFSIFYSNFWLIFGKL